MLPTAGSTSDDEHDRDAKGDKCCAWGEDVDHGEQRQNQDRQAQHTPPGMPISRLSASAAELCRGGAYFAGSLSSLAKPWLLARSRVALFLSLAGLVVFNLIRRFLARLLSLSLALHVGDLVLGCSVWLRCGILGVLGLLVLRLFLGHGVLASKRSKAGAVDRGWRPGYP